MSSERLIAAFDDIVRAIELLRAEAEGGTLQTRKLRSFDEPFLR